MHFPTIWKSKFTVLVNSEKTRSLGKNDSQQKCSDKSLHSYISYPQYEEKGRKYNF